ncbi:NUDIX domain-containing protein [Reinekea blandensis]|uniref:MutT/nudix family protein n=1 Tax=Reinekea blandensis MED297 TaxID=314283 RepID=A4BA22_9GAMM|nr:NUDIX domain-containing protein [Reinekea blandensis]EAR10778.1 MutT/nudix family protein [Reinekea sp. MED297] [Reinekea blandensis MED297]
MQYTERHHLEVSAQAAGAVIVDTDNRVLLVREREGTKKNLWHIPSGRLEAGEFPEQAAQREVFEETGLRLSFDHFLKTYVGCFDDGALVLRHVWLATLPVNAEPKSALPDEIAEVRLFSWEDVDQLYQQGQLRMHQTWLMVNDARRFLREPPERPC